MLVCAIEARPVRSLDDVRVELGPGIVSLVGPNGAGKTNFVEALYFGLTGRSFRTSDRRDLIPFGASLARAEVVVRDEDGVEHRLLASVSRAEGRRHLPTATPPIHNLAHQPPARRGLLAGPAGPDQGPARGAAGSPRPLRRGALAVSLRGCASATVRRWRNATRYLAADGAGAGAAGELDVTRTDLAEGRRAADRLSRAEASEELAETVRRDSR